MLQRSAGKRQGEGDFYGGFLLIDYLAQRQGVRVGTGSEIIDWYRRQPRAV